MPVVPHIITFTVKDLDNSTAKAGAKVFARNVTKGTQTDEATTNVNGVALIDLANLPGDDPQYETGDEVLLIVYDNASVQAGHDAVLYTVESHSKSQTLYLNPVRLGIELDLTTVVKRRVLSMHCANTTSTVYYVKLRSLDNGELLAHVEVPANDYREANFTMKGVSAGSGFVVERENKGVVVTVNEF